MIRRGIHCTIVVSGSIGKISVGMKRKEALQIIKDALGDKAKDKRTTLNKAVTLLEDWVVWEDEDLDRIIIETIEEFEKEENDYIS